METRLITDYDNSVYLKLGFRFAVFNLRRIHIFATCLYHKLMQCRLKRNSSKFNQIFNDDINEILKEILSRQSAMIQIHRTQSTKNFHRICAEFRVDLHSTISA